MVYLIIILFLALIVFFIYRFSKSDEVIEISKPIDNNNSSQTMHSFILKRQPPSYNSWKKASATKKAIYKADIEASFRHFHPSHTTLTVDLYGTLYYFFKKDRESDADNLSKPLWDCLTGFLFTDDRQVKIRTAGTFDLTKNDLSVLNFSGLRGEIVVELLDAFDNEDHIVYVECGLLNNSMFKFNLEKDGN